MIKFNRNNRYKRELIHGGKRSEYYITGLFRNLGSNKEIFIEKYNVLVYINYNEKIIYCSGNNNNGLVETLELILIELVYRYREFFYDSLHIHASGISNQNHNCILFIGEKNSGKTTCLLESLLKLNKNYVCNDNCMIEQNSESIDVIPWFEDLKVKINSIKKYNIKMEKEYEYKHSYDNSKLFIPVSTFLRNNSIIPDKRAILYSIVCPKFSADTNGKVTKIRMNFDEFLNYVNIPHDNEHANFLNILDEFDEHRFLCCHKLFLEMEKKVDFFILEYNDNNLNKVLNNLFEIINF